MKKHILLKILVGLLFFVGFFGIVSPAAAQLKANAQFYVWDDNELKYKTSIVDLFLDGSETHVIHELGFDNAQYDPQDGSWTQDVCDAVAALGTANDPSFVENCPADVATTSVGGTGKFAGVAQLGIPYDDLDGARAFDFSLDWSLIDCDLDGDLDWDNTDLTFNTLTAFAGGIPYLANWDIVNYPPMVGSPPAGTDQDDFFKILTIDTLTACSNATCANELVTTMFIDLDINGDNSLTAAGDGTPVNGSAQLPSGRVCFFARIFPITWPTNPATPSWGGNPQARFSAGGGDKTTNFNLFGPTAITLEQFMAQSPGGVHPGVWLAIIVLVAAIAIVLIREARQGQFMTIRKDQDR
jgi:hypothetical protein